MKKIFIALLTVIIFNTAKAQHQLIIYIKDSITQKPLQNVSALIQSNKKGNVSNDSGIVKLNNLTNENEQVILTHTSYEKLVLNIRINTSTDTLYVVMQPEEATLDEVIVQSTRTGRNIQNTPTRVETIDGDELDEKNNMRPANVSMLLHESTGMQVQQTSATSGNASIRIQGLDGRYTQLLKDGYPNFGNFANGLSILEIPPLDLKQVEVIKGPASTLYGGGAIAGVVNFISKLPSEKFEGNFLVNQSNVGQTNIGAYISQKHNKFGYAVLGLMNFQKAYDVDNDGFTELPRSKNFTVNPRLFFYPNASITIMLGNSFTSGINEGGDMLVLDDKADNNHVYFEKNKTLRNTTTFELDKKFNNNNNFKFKQSFSVFDRHINIPSYSFAGLNMNSFTDASYTSILKKHTIITGVNFLYDKFKQEQTDLLNAQTSTAGIYIQDTWDITDNIKAENGLRIDNVTYKNINFKNNKTFILPRVSLLFKFNNKISSRIGAGLGYKTPTTFTERTETLQYQNLLSLNNVTSEQSVGGTADINYKTKFSDFDFSINHMFFITSITKPLVLQQNINGNYFFSNADKPVVSKGIETNVRLVFKKDLKLYVGYTFTDAKATYVSTNQFLPLLPKNRVNLTLMYEKEDNFKIGFESYFTDEQYLYNGTKTPSFWELGFSAQKTFNKISLFINFENITDERQSKYKQVVNPPYNNPTFDDIWNHTEGFVMNGGIKINL